MSVLSKLQAYRFASLLSKPFKDWDAFTFGLIDEKGNILKKPKSKQEKKSLDVFNNLIRKIKKLLIKYIPDTSMFQFLVAAYLLREEKIDKEEKIIMAELNNILTDKEREKIYNILLNNYLVEVSMPLPKKDETKEEFISRCMLYQSTEKKFNLKNEKDRKQALAICFSKWKRKMEGVIVENKEFKTMREILL